MIGMFKKLPYKKILSIFLLVMYVFAIVIISRIGRVSADIKAFQLTRAKVVEKSDTAEANITIDREDNINTNFTFHKVNDFIIFDLSFKNNDDKDYYIRSIMDDNTNPHIIYDYDQHKNEVIKAGKSINIRVKLTYDDEVKDLTKRNIKDDVKFSFDIEDAYGNKVLSNVPTNSRSIDTIIGYLILAIVLLIVVVLMIIRNKKAKKTASTLCLLLLIPLTVKAATYSTSFQIVLKTEVKLHDKLVMTVVNNGEEEEVVVPYGEQAEIPKEPEKKGYDFVGWYVEDEEYTFDSTIAEDFSVTAKYQLINYDISYNLNGGEATNPVNYNVESKNIVLSNPTKEGYSFSGWTGSNGKSYQTKVTIVKGTVGNLTYTANFSANPDTKYTVVHKYKNFAGDGFDEIVVEELSGSTDSIVKPEARSVLGYANPTLKNLKITSDGNARIEYVYERAMVTLAYSSDVLSDTPAGIYKAGTQITISAKNKVGYTFNRWNVYSNGLPTFADNDNDGTISIGDNVIIGADWFYVIATPENGQVKLLPKFSINKDGRQSATPDNSSFSSYHYWENSSNYVPFGNSNNKYVYRNKDNEDANNYLKTRINAYKDFLNNLGGVNVVDVRLMSYEEAIALGCSSWPDSCPEFIKGQRFWLGSAQGQHLYTADNGLLLMAKTNSFAVRPIVIINESDISTLNATKSLATIEIMDNLNIIPSYDPNTDTPYKVIHKLQNVDDESLYEIADTIEKAGVTGDAIRPPVLTKYGSDYEAPETVLTTINADGSTVVEYLYRYKYYNVTLDPNGGSSNIESQKVVKGSATSLTIPTRDGFDFVGWYDDPDGGNLLAAPNESYTPTRSIVVYAHWESNTPSSVVYKDLDYNDALTVGDQVIVGNDVFYFIGYDNQGNYKLLPQYNLDANYKQSELNSVSVHYSEFEYWSAPGSVAAPSDYNINDFGYSGSIGIDYQDNCGEYCTYNQYLYKYTYRTANGNDVSANNLTPYINNYSNYLHSTYNLDIVDARLLNYEEVDELGCSLSDNSCPSYVGNQCYWIGSNDSFSNIYAIRYKSLYRPAYNESEGVRPVVIISQSTAMTPLNYEKIKAMLEDTNNDSQASYGDIVTIGVDQFYFVGYDDQGNYKLLAKYNLDANYRQSVSNSIELAFSTSDYWSAIALASGANPSNVPFKYNDGVMEVYKDKNGNTFTQNNLTSYVNNYASHIESTYLINLVEARLMHAHEVINTSCPSHVVDQQFWLGDVGTNDYAPLIAYNPNDNCDNYSMNYENNQTAGARPLFIVSKDDVETPWSRIATLYDSDNSLNASIGDRVTIGSDEFYFIGYDDQGNYKLLPKYNLDANYRQSKNYSVEVPFASSDYWTEISIASASPGSNYPYEYFQEPLSELYIYKTKTGADVAENNIATYVNNYSSYLQNTYNVTIVNSRLIKLADIFIYHNLSDYPLVLRNQSYWTGSVHVENYTPFIINSEANDFDDFFYEQSYNSVSGVRPLIIVSSSNVSTPWDNATKMYRDMDQSGGLSVGDYVRFNSEAFIVVHADNFYNSVNLLAVNPLGSNNKQVEYGNKLEINFSETNYWKNNESNYYDNYVYTDKNGADTNNLIKTYINSYKGYLTEVLKNRETTDLVDVRLMKYSEASSSVVNNILMDKYYYDFWLGTSYNHNDASNIYYWAGHSTYAVRELNHKYYSSKAHIVPLVIVKKSAIPTQ